SPSSFIYFIFSPKSVLFSREDFPSRFTNIGWREQKITNLQLNATPSHLSLRTRPNVPLLCRILLSKRQHFLVRLNAKHLIKLLMRTTIEIRSNRQRNPSGRLCT
ncbi:hypothetical protein PanWU01x14_001030, partial [Parasponia andersonii]